MKGLELARKFYNEFGKSMLENDFADLMPYLAVGLVGSGSECFGFDDEISKDHDFEPGFCIFIPDDKVDSRAEFALERAYAKLPREFMGYKRSVMSPVGGNRHGVMRIGDFYEKKLGCRDGKLDIQSWFSLPEYALAEAVNGEVFFDNYGKFSEIRESIINMPDDVRLKKTAGNLLLMGQAGQYNYPRCITRGDTAAAQLSAIEFVRSAMRVVFLLNNVYMPYYKWSFCAMKKLTNLSALAPVMEDIISMGNDTDCAQKKSAQIEKICAAIVCQLKTAGITEFAGDQLEGQAYSVNNKIKDPNIRNLHILYAV